MNLSNVLEYSSIHYAAHARPHAPGKNLSFSPLSISFWIREELLSHTAYFHL